MAFIQKAKYRENDRRGSRSQSSRNFSHRTHGWKVSICKIGDQSCCKMVTFTLQDWYVICSNIQSISSVFWKFCPSLCCFKKYIIQWWPKSSPRENLSPIGEYTEYLGIRVPLQRNHSGKPFSCFPTQTCFDYSIYLLKGNCDLLQNISETGVFSPTAWMSLPPINFPVGW